MRIDHKRIYTVKRGRHDFKPNPAHQYIPLSGTYSLRFSASLNLDCWYDTALWRCGESRNKLCGVGKFLSRNNRSAFLIAWYPAPKPGLFNVTLYENNERGGWEEHAGIQVEAGEVFEAVFTRQKNGQMLVTLSARERWCAHTWDRPYTGADRIRGPYFGGRCFSSMDRSLYLETKLN